jgi:hypothetical protein
MLERVADDPSKVIGDEVELSESDRAVIDTPDFDWFADMDAVNIAKGATPAIQAALVTRSGRRAATARLCGPPQEPPFTAKRSIPRLSAIAETSATESTTRRPREQSEPP